MRNTTQQDWLAGNDMTKRRQKQREKKITITFRDETEEETVYLITNKYASPIQEAIGIIEKLETDKGLGTKDICEITNLLNAISKIT